MGRRWGTPPPPLSCFGPVCLAGFNKIWIKWGHAPPMGIISNMTFPLRKMIPISQDSPIAREQRFSTGKPSLKALTHFFTAFPLQTPDDKRHCNIVPNQGIYIYPPMDGCCHFLKLVVNKEHFHCAVQAHNGIKPVIYD